MAVYFAQFVIVNLHVGGLFYWLLLGHVRGGVPGGAAVGVRALARSNIYIDVLWRNFGRRRIRRSMFTDLRYHHIGLTRLRL